MAEFISVERRTLKASHLLVQNIRALLVARGVDDKALAMWCGHKPAWLSKIMSGERFMAFKDMDKVADFFGLTAAQLLQHGISALTERRRLERRRDKDRRAKERRARDRHTLPADIAAFPVKKKTPPPDTRHRYHRGEDFTDGDGDGKPSEH